MPSNPTILLSTTLASEASVLARHFRLKSLADTRLRVWRNSEMVLVQTGQGKLNAAVATAAALGAWFNDMHGQAPVCLHVGQALCQAPAGQLLIASQVLDVASNTCWFPQLAFSSRQAHIAVHTLDTLPDSHDDTAVAFDQEASGFLCAALQTTTLELAQVYKLTKNTAGQGTEHNDERELALALGEQLGALESDIKRLQSLAEALPDTGSINSLVVALGQSLHLTTSNQSRLRKALWRYRNVHDTLPALSQLQTIANAGALIDEIEQLAATRHETQEPPDANHLHRR